MCGGGGGSVPTKSTEEVMAEERRAKAELEFQREQAAAQQAAQAAEAERQRQQKEADRQFQLMQLQAQSDQTRADRLFQSEQQRLANERADRLAAEQRAREEEAAAQARTLADQKLQAQILRATGQAGGLKAQLDAANAWDEDIFSQIALAAQSLYGQLGDATDSAAYGAITELNNAATQRMLALNRTRGDLERNARTAYDELSRRNDIASLDTVDQLAAQYAGLFDDVGKYGARAADDEVANIRAFFDKHRTRLAEEAAAKKAQATADQTAAAGQVKILTPSATTATTAGTGTSAAALPAAGANAFSTSLGAAVNADNPPRQAGWTSLF